MQRREWLKQMLTVAAASLPWRMMATINSHEQSARAERTISKLEKPKAEWRQLLPRETGWPSFYESLKGRLATKRDYWILVARTEYHCIRCGGHQGHVFEDGPPPTGQRWCNNGVALKLVPEAQPLPQLRT